MVGKNSYLNETIKRGGKNKTWNDPLSSDFFYSDDIVLVEMVTFCIRTVFVFYVVN